MWELFSKPNPSSERAPPDRFRRTFVPYSTAARISYVRLVGHERVKPQRRDVQLLPGYFPHCNIRRADIKPPRVAPQPHSTSSFTTIKRNVSHRRLDPLAEYERRVREAEETGSVAVMRQLATAPVDLLDVRGLVDEVERRRMRHDIMMMEMDRMEKENDEPTLSEASQSHACLHRLMSVSDFKLRAPHEEPPTTLMCACRLAAVAEGNATQTPRVSSH